MASGSVPKTRKQLTSRLTDFVGKGKEFEQSEVPTVRAVVQRGILMRNRLIIEQEALKNEVKKGSIARELAPLIQAQWQKSNRAVSGQEARDGYIRARVQHREAMPTFVSKKDMLATF